MFQRVFQISSGQTENLTCVTATGMSDFHKLLADSFKSQSLKALPKHNIYRNYTNFDEDNFKS